MAVGSPSNLAELERICGEEWEKLPKYRFAKLVASYPRILDAVITGKSVRTSILCMTQKMFPTMVANGSSKWTMTPSILPKLWQNGLRTSKSRYWSGHHKALTSIL